MSKYSLIFALLVCALPLRGQNSLPTNALTPEQQKALDMRLPELDRSALEPEKRSPVEVEPAERNPFGLLSVPPPEQEEEVKIEVETEEMKIRRILGNMRIAGLSGTPGSYRVLLGSVQLSKGDIVPRLFANQAERLRVEEITDRQIVLSFIERRPQQDLPPRTIGLGIDLAPRVRSLLPGELFTNVVQFDEKGALAMEPLKTESLEAVIKQIKTNGLTESLIDQRRALLGEAFASPNDESATPKEDNN